METPAPVVRALVDIGGRRLDVASVGHGSPAVVLTHGMPMQSLPGMAPGALERLHQELQADLARRLPGSTQIIASGSGHLIHKDQPELVVDAVRRVVEAKV